MSQQIYTYGPWEVSLKFSETTTPEKRGIPNIPLMNKADFEVVETDHKSECVLRNKTLAGLSELGQYIRVKYEAVKNMFNGKGIPLDLQPKDKSGRSAYYNMTVYYEAYNSETQERVILPGVGVNKIAVPNHPAVTEELVIDLQRRTGGLPFMANLSGNRPDILIDTIRGKVIPSGINS